MGCKPGPSGTTCGKEVTFEKSSLGSNGMEIQERNVVTSLEQKLVALADGEHSDVIGKRPGDAPCSRDSTGPGAEEEGDECHAKWTSLGDATKAPVNLPKPPATVLR